MTKYILKGNEPLTFQPNKDGLFDILDAEIYIQKENKKVIHAFNACATEEVFIRSVEWRADDFFNSFEEEQKDIQILYVKVLARIKQKERNQKEEKRNGSCTCERCNGMGILNYDSDIPRYKQFVCPDCQGEGVI